VFEVESRRSGSITEEMRHKMEESVGRIPTITGKFGNIVRRGTTTSAGVFKNTVKHRQKSDADGGGIETMMYH
jgi:hypothetical protein